MWEVKCIPFICHCDSSPFGGPGQTDSEPCHVCVLRSFQKFPCSLGLSFCNLEDKLCFCDIEPVLFPCYDVLLLATFQEVTLFGNHTGLLEASVLQKNCLSVAQRNTWLPSRAVHGEKVAMVFCLSISAAGTQIQKARACTSWELDPRGRWFSLLSGLVA